MQFNLIFYFNRINRNVNNVTLDGDYNVLTFCLNNIRLSSFVIIIMLFPLKNTLIGISVSVLTL